MKESNSNFIYKNVRLLKEDGSLEPLEEFYVKNGQWVSEAPKDAEIIESNGGIVFPLLTELCVDFKEPGREHIYTLEDGAEAMRRGGFGRVLLSPDSKPVIDESSNVEGLRKKTLGLGVEMLISAALSKKLESELLPEILEMIREGAVAISNGLRPLPNTKYLLSAMKYSSQKNVRLHLLPLEKDLDLDHYFPEGPLASRYGLKAVPKIAEEIGVYRLLQLAKHTGCAVHIKHITSMESVRLIEVFKKQGVDVTSDISLHHLQWDEMDLENLNPMLHIIPALVNKSVQAELRQAYDEKKIDMISCQHIPVLPEFKNTIFEASEPGISTLESALSSINTLEGEASMCDFVLRNITGASKVLNTEENWPKINTSTGWSIFDTQCEEKLSAKSFAGGVSNSPHLNSVLKGKVISFANNQRIWVV